MTRARFALLGTLATVLLACERGEPPQSPPRAVRLELTGPSPPERAEPREVRRWELGARLPETWTVDAESHTLERLPGDESRRRGSDPRRMLVLNSDEESSLHLTGSFDPQTFNQVVVELETLSISDTLKLEVQLRRNGTRVATARKSVLTSRGPSTVVFALDRNARETVPCDELVLGFDRANRLGVRALALVHEPVTNRLPQWDAPRPFTVRDEARPSLGMSSERPLTARFTASAGQQLTFSCARPLFVTRAGERPRLVVTLTADGETVRTKRIDLGGTVGQEWQDVRLSLSALAGREVEARFELRSVGEEPGQVFCVLTPPEVWVAVESPATVVLVTSDTHRADHVGLASDGAGARTPFLDGLATRGVFFDDCYASTNITNPSHATLFTGLTPRDTGVSTNMTVLGPAAETLAERFRSAGFVTFASVSVAHMRHDQSGLAQGFDRFATPQRGDGDAAEAVERLASWLPAAEGRPLFVWLHVFDAHAPYTPPAEYTAMYYPGERDPYDPNHPEPPPEQRTRWDPDLRDADYNLARYKGEVSYVDDRLRDALSLPRLSRAIIAVTADHGELLGQHGIWFVHSGLFPATAEVPLVITWPGAPGGQRIEDPVRQLDVGRTLLDLAGLEQVEFPGKNLLGRDGPTPQRFGLSGYRQSATLREGRWFLALYLKGIELSDTVQFDRHQVELFDLQEDPNCLRDVASEHDGVARRMRAHVVHWLESAAPTSLADTSTIEDIDRLEQLALLGYTDEGSAVEGALFDPECGCDRCAAYD